MDISVGPRGAWDPLTQRPLPVDELTESSGARERPGQSVDRGVSAVPAGRERGGPAPGARRDRPAAHPAFEEVLAQLSGRGDSPPANASEAARLAWAARELETHFLHQVWRVMRESVPENSLFGSSPGEQIFEDMLDEERSHLMAHSGQLGLAKQIYEQMIPYLPAPDEKG